MDLARAWLSVGDHTQAPLRTPSEGPADASPAYLHQIEPEDGRRLLKPAWGHLAAASDAAAGDPSRVDQPSLF